MFNHKWPPWSTHLHTLKPSSQYDAGVMNVATVVLTCITCHTCLTCITCNTYYAEHVAHRYTFLCEQNTYIPQEPKCKIHKLHRHKNMKAFIYSLEFFNHNRSIQKLSQLINCFILEIVECQAIGKFSTTFL